LTNFTNRSTLTLETYFFVIMKGESINMSKKYWYFWCLFICILLYASYLSTTSSSKLLGLIILLILGLVYFIISCRGDKIVSFNPSEILLGERYAEP